MSAINSTAEQGKMGRVLTVATVENLKDLWDADRGLRKPEDSRRVLLTDALVDTGATLLALPTRYIQQLGLLKTRERPSISAQGAGTINIYEPVRLTILERFCSVEVMEVPDEEPARIGDIPLLALDLIIDRESSSLESLDYVPFFISLSAKQPQAGRDSNQTNKP